MKETINNKKACCKEKTEIQIGELVWLNTKRREPNINYNKAKDESF